MRPSGEAGVKADESPIATYTTTSLTGWVVDKDKVVKELSDVADGDGVAAVVATASVVGTSVAVSSLDEHALIDSTPTTTITRIRYDMDTPLLISRPNRPRSVAITIARTRILLMAPPC
jgi:hypothetical protein